MTTFWVELFQPSGPSHIFHHDALLQKSPRPPRHMRSPQNRPRLCPPMTQRSVGWQRPSHLLTTTIHGSCGGWDDRFWTLLAISCSSEMKGNDSHASTKFWHTKLQDVTSKYWEWQESLVGLGIGRRGYCTMAFMGTKGIKWPSSSSKSCFALGFACS